MAKKIYEKFDVKKISGMPRLVFPGRVFVISTEREAAKAVDYIMTHDLVGVDTETRPSFRKNVSYKVSLLQVSTGEECFLFRLNILGISASIKRFLESKVKKVGASLHDDILMMSKRESFRPKNFIDVQDMIEALGVKDKALRKMYANLLGKNISKAQQLSNWEADVLSDAQKQYAATDAWACINLYDEINRLVATRDYEFIAAPKEEDSEALKIES